MMNSTRSTCCVDILCVAVMLIVGLLSLVVLDRNPTDLAWTLRTVGAVTIAAVTLFWGFAIWALKKTDQASAAGKQTPDLQPPCKPLWTRIATAILLFSLAWIVYFQPLCLHFWGGFDEFACLQAPKLANHWVYPPGGRPLLFAPTQLYCKWFFPDRIEGFLWLAFGLWVVNSLLLKAILDRVMPGAGMVGVLAAILLIANRADPLRYMVMWSALYYLRPLFWILLGTWLMLRSYDRQQRPLLVVACVAAAISLLTSEGTFPLMLLVPVLLWTIKRDWNSYLVWSGLWIGTTAVLAIKFTMFLVHRGGQSYQARQLGDILTNPNIVIFSFLSKITRIWEYFNWSFYPQHWFRWCLIALLVAITIRVATHGKQLQLRPNVSRWGIAIAVIGVLCGILPFLHLSTTARTQFLAAPAQAAFVAFSLLLIANRLPQHLRSTMITATVAIVVANGAVHSYEDQSQRQPIHFEKTVRIFQQLHAISPRLADDTLVVFVLEQPGHSPLGPNYHVRKLSQTILGADAGQLEYEDPIGENVTLSATEIQVNSRDDGADTYRYDQLVALRLSFDGTLTLLEEIPSSLVPDGGKVTGYAPLNRIRTGRIEPLPFLRYPSWLSPMQDVFDAQDGVLLGEGWSARTIDAHGVSRCATNEARLVVNPQQRSVHDIEFDVEPISPSEAKYCTFALSRGRDPIAVQGFPTGRQKIRARIQLPIGHPTVLRLTMQSNCGGGDHSARESFRVFSISLKPPSGPPAQHGEIPIAERGTSTQR